MTTKKHPNSTMAEQSLSQDPAEPVQLIDESRRRFSKAGLTASGVILTLASQPVLGDFACQSPSGFQSGNVSQHGEPTLCSGLTPGYWQGKKDWPSSCDKGTCTNTRRPSSNDPLDWTGGTPFNTMFHCGNNGAKYYCKACLPTKKSCTMTEPLSLMQVLLLGGNLDPYQLGAHFVAALLNAEMGYTKDVLTVPAVKNMFNEWDMNGCYEPSAGIQWYAEDIVRYLQTTMK